MVYSFLVINSIEVNRLETIKRKNTPKYQIKKVMRKAGSSGSKINIISRDGKWVAVKEGRVRAAAKADSQNEVLVQVLGKLANKKPTIEPKGKPQRIMIHGTDGSIAKVLILSPTEVNAKLNKLKRAR